MTRTINTYEDLIKRKEQLEVLLQAQKELVLYDFEQLKQGIEPALSTFNFLGKISTRSGNNLLISEGTDKLIDLVVKKLILARAGWMTKLVLPYFLKNYSSHFIADHTDQFIKKLFSWIGHKNGNGKAAPETFSKEERTED